MILQYSNLEYVHIHNVAKPNNIIFRNANFSHLGSVKAVHSFGEVVQFMDVGVSAFNGFQYFGTNEIIDEDRSFVSDLVLFRQSHDLIIGAWK